MSRHGKHSAGTHRFQIALPLDQFERWRAYAVEHGATMADLIREAVEMRLRRKRAPTIPTQRVDKAPPR